MSECKFCRIAAGTENQFFDKAILENDSYFAIPSIGSLVEGWMLVVPRTHKCSMRSLYNDPEFVSLMNQLIVHMREVYKRILLSLNTPQKTMTP
jgi:diadenosine tetraphosphate (Ap4A) HIT family hydrolase